MARYSAPWWLVCTVCLPTADGSPRHHYERTRKPKHITRPALRLIPGGATEDRP